MAISLILSVISTQNEIKNAVRVASSEITVLRKEMRTVNHNFEQKLKELKQGNSQLEAQLENVHPNAKVDRLERAEQEKLAYCLFTGNLFPEPFIEHPLDENSKRKRRFS
jgi:vacuolar-type H+-ATPase subunit I/STV1